MKKKAIDGQVQSVVILPCPNCDGMIGKPLHLQKTYYKPQISEEDNCYASNAIHVSCPKCGRDKKGNSEKQAVKNWNSKRLNSAAVNDGSLVEGMALLKESPNPLKPRINLNYLLTVRWSEWLYGGLL